MSGAVLFIKDDLDLNEVQEEVLVGSLNLVSAIGCLIAGRVADMIGRRKTMAVAALISLLGTVQMTLAPSFSMLLTGRLLTGIGVGISLTIAPLYISEVSPAEIRGRMVSLPEVFVNIGILLGYLANYLLSTSPINWRLMLGFGCIPAVLLLSSLIVLPESPRWLVLQNRTREAESVLSKICRDREEALFTLSEMIITAKAQTDELSCSEAGATDIKQALTNNAHFQSNQKLKNDGSGVWLQLLCPTPNVRKLLIIALSLQFFQQASGIDALVYYTPSVLNQSGMTSKSTLLGATMTVGITKALFVPVASIYLDTVGRRPLLLASSLGMSAAMAVVGVSLASMGRSLSPTRSLPSQLELGSISALVAICAYMAFFSIGFGPICAVLTSEIFPSRLRSQALSLGTVMNRTVSGGVAFSFLSIANAIGPPGTFFLFAGICLASAVFVYTCIPETKGKTLEELSK
ncbi:hypothetical protein O6H91_05G090100 [Diphasiastrum complanatum]|nr:hypothetical protein O6H91_05G090100 [Diphasiastrum complanatum]